MNLAMASLHLNCSIVVSPKSLSTNAAVAATLLAYCLVASGSAGSGTGSRNARSVSVKAASAMWSCTKWSSERRVVRGDEIRAM